MNCERARDLLPFLHDGSLAPETAREVSGHVERCGICRAEYAELTRTLSFARRCLEKRIPGIPLAAYHEAVMRKIRKRGREHKVAAWALPAAAAIFLAASITSYSLFQGGFRSRTAGTVPAALRTEMMEEGEIINAMYHYADVSVYDVLSNLDEEAWETGTDSGEVNEE